VTKLLGVGEELVSGVKGLVADGAFMLGRQVLGFGFGSVHLGTGAERLTECDAWASP